MSARKKSKLGKLPISRPLRAAIKMRGLIAYAAARSAGGSVDAVQRFLNEERELSLLTVDKLAHSVGMTLCANE